MRTKVLTSAIVFLIAATTAFASGDKDKTKNSGKNKASETSELIAISGIVRDAETGEALAGVLVKIEETGTTIYTDFEGNFELMIAPGSYTLTTSMISYAAIKSPVEVKPAADIVTLKLENLSVKR